jgi:hypothetical protein
MRSLLLAIMLFVTVPVTVIAGAKEDAYQIVEKFKRAFYASDAQGIVNLFAPDAVFLGTVSALLEVWMASRTDADIRRVFARLEDQRTRPLRVHGEYVWPKSRRIDRGAVSDGWRGLPAPRPRLAEHAAEENDAG